jgi:hypothetical protein
MYLGVKKTLCCPLEERPILMDPGPSCSIWAPLQIPGSQGFCPGSISVYRPEAYLSGLSVQWYTSTGLCPQELGQKPNRQGGKNVHFGLSHSRPMHQKCCGND